MDANGRKKFGQAMAELRRYANIAKEMSPFNLFYAITRNGYPADLVGIQVASAYIYRSPGTIRGWVRRKEIQGYYIKTRVLVSLAEILQRSCTQPNALQHNWKPHGGR